MSAVTSPTDALALLERHHHQIDELFEAVPVADGADARAWALRQAVQHVNGLMESEEAVLIPRLGTGDALVAEAMVQHERIRARIDELLELLDARGDAGADADALDGRCRALRDAVLEHHRFEQETFFPHVAEALPDPMRESLGRALAVCMVRLHAAGAVLRGLHLRTMAAPR